MHILARVLTAAAPLADISDESSRTRLLVVRADEEGAMVREAAFVLTQTCRNAPPRRWTRTTSKRRHRSDAICDASQRLTGVSCIPVCLRVAVDPHRNPYWIDWNELATGESRMTTQ